MLETVCREFEKERKDFERMEKRRDGDLEITVPEIDTTGKLLAVTH